MHAAPAPANPLLVKRSEPASEQLVREKGVRTVRYAYGVEPGRLHFPLRLARYAGVAEAIANAVNAAPQDTTLKLLDVGSGRGRSLRYTEPFNLQHRIEWHGVDLESQRAHKPEHWASLTDLDVESGLPFDDAAFDIAICEQVLEHLQNPTKVLQDMARILKPGGLIIAGVPTFAAPVAAARRLLISEKAQRIETGHPQTFSSNSFAKLIESAGFTVTNVRGFRILSGGLLKPLENTPWWYSLNRKVGAALPSLCVETQVLATRNPR